MRSHISFLVLTVVLSFVSPARAVLAKERIYKIKEQVDSPRGWVKYSQPPPDHTITLRVGLQQPNFSELERHLYEVSDPVHPRYGQHLSKTEVDTLVAPHQESIDAVNEWLAAFSIADEGIVHSSAKDWVTLKVSVSLAEKMLDTKYHVWKHISSGEYLVRATSYSLPTNLHDHIDVVQRTTMFGRFKQHKSMVSFPGPDIEILESTPDIKPVVAAVTGVPVDASCNHTVTITCLQQLYNAVGYTPLANDSNSIAITEQFANIQDLQSFYADQRPDALNSSFAFISVAGGENYQTLSEAGAEASLDVQFAFGLSHPIAPTFFSTAGRPPFIPDTGTPTDTMSLTPNGSTSSSRIPIPPKPYRPVTEMTSKQVCGCLIPQGIRMATARVVPKSFAIRACNSFAQLGARGVSLMFSGDGGVGDGDPNPTTQECFTNDGTDTTKFIPGFPASCPFVTAVGGTTGIAPEIAVNRFFSGGGFSNYGIPDVAAQGDFFNIFLSGRAVLIGGTSASSPAFTGFVALLNDARLRAGLPSLGFLNPFIYSRGFWGLKDITIGSNPGCGTPGFNATVGWDPGMNSLSISMRQLIASVEVTGFGTPNFKALKKLVT
ncbi:hypothetical protein NLJ89_g1307 [Agrocybe chaxingu]|uniref:Peptidase S53 domain-containing protein n=1 Tax=Agrocybe chaxingu TaxID=84603 RepID=A0A9W8N091_9AGAR|nr:hypothetical protein NLJ89_g1307 [Agrocybe chaxingu]